MQLKGLCLPIKVSLSIGHLAAFSFHETKNYTSGGEGGLLIINDEQFVERAEIIREKGTNRSLFFRGAVDKYSWVDIGSSYLPCELQAAYLYAQLEMADAINEDRLDAWNAYAQGLQVLASKGQLQLASIADDVCHNAHMFYIKLKDLTQRQDLINYLKEQEIATVFHYIPLHSSVAGSLFSEFRGTDQFTTKESERLLRLPMYYGLSKSDIARVITHIENFFS